MAVVNVNNLLIAMQNGSTFEEALKQFNLSENDITPETREELQRQMDEHNQAVSEEEQQLEREADRVKDEVNESNGNY